MLKIIFILWAFLLPLNLLGDDHWQHGFHGGYILSSMDFTNKMGLYSETSSGNGFQIGYELSRKVYEKRDYFAKTKPTIWLGFFQHHFIKEESPPNSVFTYSAYNSGKTFFVKVPLRLHIGRQWDEKQNTSLTVGIGPIIPVCLNYQVSAFFIPSPPIPPGSGFEAEKKGFQMPSEISDYFGAFYQLGVKHRFGFGSGDFSVGIHYQKDLTDWKYEEVLPDREDIQEGTLNYRNEAWVFSLGFYPF